ncbi:MAG TPA: hypothetical protein VII94_01975 [Candidatus Saccharimonadales bacterium]
MITIVTIANHILIGSSIAVTVNEPILALPLAFVSHFVLDSLPHFGYARGGYEVLLKKKMTYFVLLLDILGISIVIFTFHFSEILILACAVLAISPDAEWPYRYFLFERKGEKPPSTFLTDFHRRIQWCERPWGLYVEILIFIGVLASIHHYILH